MQFDVGAAAPQILRVDAKPSRSPTNPALKSVHREGMPEWQTRNYGFTTPAGVKAAFADRDIPHVTIDASTVAWSAGCIRRARWSWGLSARF